MGKLMQSILSRDNKIDVPIWQLFASPLEVANKALVIKCPNCGKEIGIKVNIR